MLDTAQFKEDLKAVYTGTYATTGSAEAALDAFLDAFCEKAEAYIKTATVHYTDGLVAGPYSVIGTFNGTLQ